MSFIMPILPENAPFSPLQRAWLDGYLSGLFGDGDAPDPVNAPTPQPDAADSRAEDFPWHDPILTLEERLALAEGRPAAQRLMSATAQLDCGQCGYLCQSYAEAIASGAEKQLTRCVPGGKATSRALKELLASVDAPFAPAQPASPAAPRDTPPALSSEPAAARLVAVHRLSQKGSQKDTRHVVIAGETGTLQYEVGDSLCIVARNCPELVQAIIERLGAGPDAPVLSPDGVERPLAEALFQHCEIRRPSDQAIEVLSSRAHDIDESRVLQAMAEGYPGAGPEDADLLDLLETFPTARPPLSELISSLDPLEPRLYSIASSAKAIAGEVHLTVEPVRLALTSTPAFRK